MDEKKVREAIAWLETKREIHKRGVYKSPIIPKEQIDMIEGYYNLTIEALEKQLPKKVNYEVHLLTMALQDIKWQNALLVKDGIEAMMKTTIAQVVGRNLIGRKIKQGIDKI